MKENVIQIKIAGTVGSGSTTIALLIQKLLWRELGITVPIEQNTDHESVLNTTRAYIGTRLGRQDFIEKLNRNGVKLSIIDNEHIAQSTSIPPGPE